MAQEERLLQAQPQPQPQPSRVQRLYAPGELAVMFVVGIACVLQLHVDKSVMSVVVVLCTVAVAYVALAPPNAASVTRDSTGGPGAVLLASDRTLMEALDRLAAFRDFDASAHADVRGGLEAFYGSYGALLMLPRGTAGELASQELDRMYDARRQVLNTMYSFFVASPDIQQDFHGIVRTVAAATGRCTQVLARKHPRLRVQLDRLRHAGARPSSSFELV